MVFFTFPGGCGSFQSDGRRSKRERPTRMSRKLCAFGCDAESPIGNRLFFEIAELTKLVHYLNNQLHS